MKKTYLYWVGLALALLMLLSFAACTGGNGEESTTEETGTAAETETELPRFDYFSADMSEYVEIDKSDYESMTVTLDADMQITDADIERHIMQQRYEKREGATETETMVDEPLEWGDDAYIYYTGYLNGEPFEGGSNEDGKEPSLLGLGSASFIPGFEEGLVGVIPSQTSKDNRVELSLRFPSWYQSNKLAGQDVVFKVYVVYAVEYTIPDYDVTFVEDVLKYDFKEDYYASDRARLAEFEEEVRKYLEESMEQTVKDKTYAVIWKTLAAKATFKKLPEEELAYYHAYYMGELESAYEYYTTYGYDVGTFEEFVRTTMGLDKKTGDWEAEMDRAAVEYVQYDVLRYAIAELEGMKTVTESELEAEYTYWISYYEQNYGTTASKAEIAENLGEHNLLHSALTSKIGDFLYEQCTVVFGEAEASEPSTPSEPSEPSEPSGGPEEPEETVSPEELESSEA